MDRFVFSILNQSDLIHILTSPEPVYLKRTHNLIERLKKDFHFQETKMKIIINEYRLSKLKYRQQMAILNYPIFATLPKREFDASDRLILDGPGDEYAKAVKRIAREVDDMRR